MTTILPLPNIFLYLLIKRATDVLSDICPCVFESISSCVNTEENLVSEDVVEQTQKAFENIGVLLEASGLTYDDIVKTTVLLDDMNDFAKVNE